MAVTQGQASFTVRSRGSDGAYVVEVGGALEGAGTRALTEELIKAAASGLQRIDVDLEHVAFIDGAGVTALATAGERARARDKQLRICRLSPPVLTAFRQTNLTAFLVRRGTLDPSQVERSKERRDAAGSRRGRHPAR